MRKIDLTYQLKGFNGTDTLRRQEIEKDDNGKDKLVFYPIIIHDVMIDVGSTVGQDGQSQKTAYLLSKKIYEAKESIILEEAEYSFLLKAIEKNPMKRGAIVNGQALFILESIPKYEIEAVK